ncbi:hypothetical protein GCM10023178_34330 [Actinomadura luteofluorescens]
MSRTPLPPRTPFRHRTPLTRRGPRRRLAPVLAAAALLIGTFAASPAHAAPKASPSGAAVDVYAAELTADQVRLLNRSALDREDVRFSRSARKDRVHVEAVMSGTEAAALNARGLALSVRKVNGKDARQRALAAPKVFRPYSGPGNIREELLKVAAGHPSIATAVDVGTSGQGQPITAVRVSRDVRGLRDGRRPVVVYQAAQHAREWTPLRGRVRRGRRGHEDH